MGERAMTQNLPQSIGAKEVGLTPEVKAELLQLLVNNIKEYAIIILDPKGHVTTWNPAAERIKGYAADEIIGRHFSIFYPPEENSRARAEQELEITAREGRFEYEGWRVRKDGTKFWANVVVTALRDKQDRLIGFGKIT